MTASVDQAFVKQYEAEVHVAYQQKEAKLRNFLRLKTGVVGASTTFQKMGKGVATQKTRQGNVVPMDLTHTNETATLSDWYAPDYIDSLDEAKIKHNERQVIVTSGASALARKADQLVIDSVYANATLTSNTIDSTGVDLAFKHFREADRILNSNEVPSDGGRVYLLDAYTWSYMLEIDQFARSEYAGNHYPILKGTDARMYMNSVYMLHNGIEVNTGTGFAKPIVFHKSALGLAEGVGISSEINYIPEKVSHLANNKMSMGACVIDTDGIQVLKVKLMA